MPLVNLRSLVEEAEANNYALAGFNILNLEMIEGVVEAARTLGLPVVINVHPDQISHTIMEVIAATAKEAAIGRITELIGSQDATDMVKVSEGIKYAIKEAAADRLRVFSARSKISNSP